MEYTLRLAEPSDKERIEQLFTEMLRSINSTDTTEGYDEKYIDTFFTSPHKRIFVTVINGNVQGYLSVEVHNEHGGFLYLDDFSVAEVYRGKGMGTALIKAAEEYAHENDIRSIVLHVDVNNLKALQFYECLGYCIESEEGSRYRMNKVKR